MHRGVISPAFGGGASVWPANFSIFYLSYSPLSSSCLAISSYPETYFLGLGLLACLKLLQEGSAVFSHINSVSGDFSLICGLIYCPTTLYGTLFDGLWKKLWPVCPCRDMTDCRWLFLCLFLDGSYSHSNLFWRICMAFLFLRSLEFLIRAVGEEYKWSFIIYHHIPRIWAVKFITLISYVITRGPYFGSAHLDVGVGK